jgi:hypothetical protein
MRTNVIYQRSGSGVVTSMAAGKMLGTPVQGAPYSATISNESVQTLADGNRIVQSNTGATARDSLGRTRQDAPLPAIGNLSAAHVPHLVFIMDPVAQTSYTLDLTDITAHKLSMPPGGGGPAGNAAMPDMAVSGAAGPGKVFLSQVGIASGMSAPPPPEIAMVKGFGPDDQSEVSSEDLGSQIMEGVPVTGLRTTRTIPAGEIGNEKPLSIVTEVWTSPDLKTIVYSKRSDPRMGEQTFKLTNIVRAEPDPSLFAVPPDFKLMEGPQNFIYRTNP